MSSPKLGSSGYQLNVIRVLMELTGTYVEVLEAMQGIPVDAIRSGNKNA